MKERKKCKSEPSQTSMRQMVLEIFHFKVRNLARWTSPFYRFSASFSIKYNVTEAILQDNEKMKVQYLRSRLVDLFEIWQAVRTWQRKFALFQILLLWQPESKLLSIIEKTKGLLFKQK